MENYITSDSILSKGDLNDKIKTVIYASTKWTNTKLQSDNYTKIRTVEECKMMRKGYELNNLIGEG